MTDNTVDFNTITETVTLKASDSQPEMTLQQTTQVIHDEPVEEKTEEEKLTDEDIKKLTDIVQIESIKNDLAYQTEELHKKQQSLLATVKTDQPDFISERLKNYTVDELEEKLHNDDFVDSFFVDPETNQPVDFTVTFESKSREMDFKRGLLSYFKATDETFKKIDEEFETLNKETADINVEIQDAVKSLSDNVLAYISMLTDKANAMENEILKNKLLTTIKYIRSGYDMTIFVEAADQHPTIAKKCVTELNNDDIIKKTGARYLAKLKSNKVNVNLIDFASDIQDGKKSFEEIMLVRDEQYIVPDLFVYSLIRFFAMADWNKDNNIRKAHASVILVIRKLLKNEFVDEVKKDVIDAIVKYLAKFEVNE